MYVESKKMVGMIFFCKAEIETQRTNVWIPRGEGGVGAIRRLGLTYNVVRVWLFVTPWIAACQVPYPLPSPRICSNSCPLSQWCHPTISSSVAPFLPCPQPFPASGSFLMGWLFILGGQSIRASASALVLPMNIQGWFPLGLISLQPKGFSRVFSSTIRKDQFFLSGWTTFLWWSVFLLYQTK